MQKMITPLEIKGEEKIIGGKMSLRQAGYWLIGVCTAYLISSLLHRVMAAVAPSPIPVVFAAVAFPVILTPFIIFAHIPAGLGPLPGPALKQSDDPYDVPMRLDQWLWLMWKQRNKQKVLVYSPRRSGHKE